MRIGDEGLYLKGTSLLGPNLEGHIGIHRVMTLTMEYYKHKVF